MPRLLTFVVFLFLSIAVSLKSAVAEEAPIPKWNFRINSTIRSEYVDPYGIAQSTHPVIQDEVTITSPSGIYFDLWHSHQLSRPGNFDYDFGDEVDASVGWSGTLWDKKPYSLEVDLGVIYEDYLDLGDSKGDIFLPYIELGHEFDIGKVTIEPYVRFEYSIPANGNPDGDLSGAIAYAGVKTNVELSSKWDLNEKIQFETDDGAFGYKSGGALVDLTSTLSYKLNDTVSFNLEGRLTKSLDDSLEKHATATVGLGVTVSF